MLGNTGLTMYAQPTSIARVTQEYVLLNHRNGSPKPRTLQLRDASRGGLRGLATLPIGQASGASHGV